MTDFPRVIKALADGEIEFIVIGGLAATIHGSSTGTSDIDIVYRRSATNLKRIIATLAPQHPHLRGAPPDLPFLFDVKTLQAGMNFTLSLDFGDLDLLGEASGGGTYESLLPASEAVSMFDRTIRVVTLEKLIQLKRAAGRQKDMLAVAELERLREQSPDR